MVADCQLEAGQGDVLDGSLLPGDDVAESRPGDRRAAPGGSWPFPEESREE